MGRHNDSFMSKPSLTLREQLNSVPVRNERAQVTRGADGTAVVTVEVSCPPWMKPFRRWFAIRPTARFRLDATGTDVYDSIDGRKTFERLVDEFAAKHDLTFHESRAMMMNYVQMLMKRGLIAVAVKESVNSER